MEKELVQLTIIDRDEQVHTLEAPTDMGMNLMEVLKSYELPVEGICGGMAMCASCHCYIQGNEDLLERNDAEQAMLDETEDVKERSRLACQIPISEKLEGLVVELAPENMANNLEDW